MFGSDYLSPAKFASGSPGIDKAFEDLDKALDDALSSGDHSHHSFWSGYSKDTMMKKQGYCDFVKLPTGLYCTNYKLRSFYKYHLYTVHGIATADPCAIIYSVNKTVADSDEFYQFLLNYIICRWQLRLSNPIFLSFQFIIVPLTVGFIVMALSLPIISSKHSVCKALIMQIILAIIFLIILRQNVIIPSCYQVLLQPNLLVARGF